MPPYLIGENETTLGAVLITPILPKTLSFRALSTAMHCPSDSEIAASGYLSALPSVEIEAVLASVLVIPTVVSPHCVIFSIKTSVWVSSSPLAACHTPSVCLALVGSICSILTLCPKWFFT